MMWPLHDAGLIGGAKGAVADAVAVGALALVGGLLGALSRRWNMCAVGREPLCCA